MCTTQSPSSLTLSFCLIWFSNWWHSWTNFSRIMTANQKRGSTYQFENQPELLLYCTIHWDWKELYGYNMNSNYYLKHNTYALWKYLALSTSLTIRCKRKIVIYLEVIKYENLQVYTVSGILSPTVPVNPFETWNTDAHCGWTSSIFISMLISHWVEILIPFIMDIRVMRTGISLAWTRTRRPRASIGPDIHTFD